MQFGACQARIGKSDLVGVAKNKQYFNSQTFSSLIETKLNVHSVFTSTYTANVASSTFHTLDKFGCIKTIL